jgi:hypothetical protein
MFSNRNIQAIALVGVLAASTAACAEEPASLVGVWTATSDEDGTPADVFDIKPDGTYVNYGIGCRVNAEMPYHLFRGDLYVTSEIPGKGPVAIVFRPNADGSKLTYTSPRTRNNAVYEKLPSNPCSPKG